MREGNPACSGGILWVRGETMKIIPGGKQAIPGEQPPVKGGGVPKIKTQT